MTGMASSVLPKRRYFISRSIGEPGSVGKLSREFGGPCRNFDYFRFRRFTTGNSIDTPGVNIPEMVIDYVLAVGRGDISPQLHMAVGLSGEGK